jgi:hypothetical protein
MRDITNPAAALLLPDPGSFYELNQERLRKHCQRLSEASERLEALETRWFAAAAQLMSINPPPVAWLRSYTDIANGGSVQ